MQAFVDAITKADNGDVTALAMVLEVFGTNFELAESLSGLAYNAEAAILASVPAGAAELFRAQTRTLRRQLREEGTGSAL